MCARLKSTFDFRRHASQLLLLRPNQRLREPVERFELLVAKILDRHLPVQNLQRVLGVAGDGLKLAGVTLHAFRHTHASQLIAAGMDVLTISRRLGHGTPTLTLGVYGHLFSNTDDQAAQMMERAFSGLTSQ